MAIDLKLTAEEKKQMSSFVKPTPQGKLFNPKEKVKEFQDNVNLAIRSQPQK